MEENKNLIELSLKDAQVLYEDGGDHIKEILLKSFSKDDLECVRVPSWRGLIYVEGRTIDGKPRGRETKHSDSSYIFNSELYVKSAIAFNKLSWIIKELGDECVCAWEDPEIIKHCIIRVGNNIVPYGSYDKWEFLAFNDEGVRNEFAHKHIDLIKDYFMIY